MSTRFVTPGFGLYVFIVLLNGFGVDAGFRYNVTLDHGCLVYDALFLRIACIWNITVITFLACITIMRSPILGWIYDSFNRRLLFVLWAILTLYIIVVPVIGTMCLFRVFTVCHQFESNYYPISVTVGVVSFGWVTLVVNILDTFNWIDLYQHQRHDYVSIV